MIHRSRQIYLSIGILLINLTLLIATPAKSQTAPQQPSQSQASPTNEELDLDIDPAIIDSSPTLQRWQKEVPNVLEEIRNDPSFNTRFRFGYSLFPSSGDIGGLNLGVEDIFIDRTGLTVSGDYQFSFNGDRQAGGVRLNYFVLPLGDYVNFAPVVGYRYIQTGDYSSDGINIGARLMLSLSRTGAADISITQSFVAPGSSEEVGITSLSVGYALTSQLRLSGDIEKQNSIAEKDSRVAIVLEWMIRHN